MLLIGGEPSIHPKILEICRYLVGRKVDVAMITNGSRQPSCYVELLDYIRYLTFSVHFSEKYDRTVASILASHEVLQKTNSQSSAKAREKFLWVSLMMEAGYFEEAKKTKELLESHGIACGLRRVRPRFDQSGHPILNDRIRDRVTQKRDLQNQAGVATEFGYYSSEEIEYLRLHRAKASKEFHNTKEIWKSDGGEYQTEDTNPYSLAARELNYFQGWKCWVGKETLFVEDEGSIYRATCAVGGKIGNVFEDFELPQDPVVCTSLRCTGGEVNVSKVRSSEHLQALRTKD